MQNLKNKIGFALTEVLLSVALIGICATISASITTDAIRAISLSKNFLIAQNALTEGVEIVKIIRDTNWLINPNNKKTCWLRIVPDNNTLCNAVNIPDSSGSFSYFTKTVNNTFALESSLAALDLKTGEALNSKYQVNNPAFYRSITFTSVTPKGADFIVKVQWKEGAKVMTLERSSTISNSL